MQNVMEEKSTKSTKSTKLTKSNTFFSILVHELMFQWHLLLKNKMHTYTF